MKDQPFRSIIEPFRIRAVEPMQTYHLVMMTIPNDPGGGQPAQICGRCALYATDSVSRSTRRVPAAENAWFIKNRGGRFWCQ